MWSPIVMWSRPAVATRSSRRRRTRGSGRLKASWSEIPTLIVAMGTALRSPPARDYRYNGMANLSCRRAVGMPTRGITVLAGGHKETQEITRRAEAAGFDAAWSGEFLHRSGIVSAAAMAAVTTRIGVGTSIAYAVGRSPLVLANDAKFIDEMSDGRFTLGLGTGTRRMMTDWHGVPDPDGPASRIEELVPLLHRLWGLNEGPVRHQGRFYSVDITPTAEIEPPLRADIPVYTAGVNPRMTEAAGRVADGLICHPTITGRYLDDVARPAIARGAAKAGRSPADVRLMGIIICSIADDTVTARREAAAQVAFYAAPKAYGPVMEAAGFGREAAAVRDAFRA